MNIEERIQSLFEKPRKRMPRRSRDIGRNEQCPCGSGKKYKHCHYLIAFEVLKNNDINLLKKNAGSLKK